MPPAYVPSITAMTYRIVEVMSVLAPSTCARNPSPYAIGWRGGVTSSVLGSPPTVCTVTPSERLPVRGTSVHVSTASLSMSRLRVLLQPDAFRPCEIFEYWMSAIPSAR